MTWGVCEFGTPLYTWSTIKRVWQSMNAKEAAAQMVRDILLVTLMREVSKGEGRNPLAWARAMKTDLESTVRTVNIIGDKAEFAAQAQIECDHLFDMLFNSLASPR